MFKLFSKLIKGAIAPGCKSCMHYSFVSTPDRLNPDKTITKGKLQYEFCNKGKFYLDDHKACDFHEEGKRSGRIMPPPKP